MNNRVPPPLYMIAAGVIMWLLSHSPYDVVVKLAPLVQLGSAIMFGGAAVALLAAWQFQRARTTIDPLNPAKATQLVTSGVFQFSRNPMYLGMALVLSGFACRLGSLLSVIVVVAFIALITQLQIKPEERALEGLFGQAFADYRAKVRRWV